MTGQSRFTLSNLFKLKSPGEQTRPATAGSSPAKGLGLEIANVSALPFAVDYAADAFYVANFTPSEIAYCAKQPKAKAAFQGLLAAKRAIAKSGAVSEPAEGLAKIETSFDSDGNPVFPGCLLSLSDTGTFVAAACLWLPGVAIGAVTAPRQVRVFPLRSRIYAFAVLISLLLLFALGIWKLLELAR